LQGKPVYTISEVALIPLSSQQDAEQAIARARSAQFRHSTSNDDFLSDSSDSEEDITLPDDASVATAEPDDADKTKADQPPVSRVAEEVMTKKGVYGRFADRWFSTKGWNARNRTSQGLSSEEDLQVVKNVPSDPAAEVQKASGESTPDLKSQEKADGKDQVAPAEVAPVIESKQETQQFPLLPKLLTTTKMFFGSRNFFFSYDYDLSRTVANQSESSSSLHKTFDSKVSLLDVLHEQRKAYTHSSSGTNIFFNPS